MDATTALQSFDIIPRCLITDEFILELKDAELHRTIEYSNTTSSPVPISLEKKELLYPYHCEDFISEVNGIPIVPTVIPANYIQKIIINSPEIILQPGENLVVKLICRWRDFYNFLSDFHYTFQYDDVCEYTINFKNFSLFNALYILRINNRQATKGKDYFIEHNSVSLKPVQVSPSDSEFCIKLFSISTPKDLGVLEATKENNKNLFSNYTIIIIQHLLSDAVHLIESFQQGGADKDGIFIVGIPYSTKYPTVKYLKLKGYNNILAPSKYPFEREVKQMIENAIQYSERTGKNILVVEDGGYVVPLIHQHYSDKINLFIGAVEQTANGIWRDQELIGSNLLIPVINIAESDLKKRLESPLIGRSVTKNIELIYNKSYRGIAGVDIGIIGYGSTGSQVAKSLKNMGAIVSVYDDKSTLRSLANTDGFKVGDSVRDIVKNNKIIVEATGRSWAQNSHEMTNIILDFKHGSYVVSASSKRMGINYEEFEKLIDKDRILNLPGVGVQYTLRNNSDIILIADGYPVNFFLGESVPDRDISFILAWLYKGAEIMVKNLGALPKGVISTDDTSDMCGLLTAQNEISQLHEKKLN